MAHDLERIKQRIPLLRTGSPFAGHVLSRHDDEMPLGGGRVGSERDGGLGVYPDAFDAFGPH
jgi:hypothetical protein